MPEKSLKDLTSAVYKIAENSPKIQKDVKDIRDAIVGTDGLVESVKQLTKKLDDMQKKGILSKITGKSGNRYDRIIIKSTSSIEKTLPGYLMQQYLQEPLRSKGMNYKIF